jgi:hypothetical protein
VTGFTLYQAVRLALIGQTVKRGDWVSVDTLAAVVSAHIGDEVSWELVLGSIADMHDYGMATRRGNDRSTEVRYDGIVVHLNPSRKVAIVTEHGYAIADWEYLLNPDHRWTVERIPSWALATSSNA